MRRIRFVSLITTAMLAIKNVMDGLTASFKYVFFNHWCIILMELCYFYVKEERVTDAIDTFFRTLCVFNKLRNCKILDKIII